jgi:hypothetical protein
MGSLVFRFIAIFETGQAPSAKSGKPSRLDVPVLSYAVALSNTVAELGTIWRGSVFD